MTDNYTLPNSWTDADRRLGLLQQCYDPSTFRRIGDLGIREGWRCLDAGAGAGSVARWLSGQVGDHGKVRAVDLDVGLLEAEAGPNLEVQQLDLRVDDLPPATFDLVHARLVLTHIPNRVDVLRKFVGALRPGGVLLVEEADAYPMVATGTGSYRTAAEAGLVALEGSGADFEWARNLPSALDACGLVDVEAEQDVPLFRGSSPMAEWVSLTWLQIRDRLLAMGGSVADLDAGRDLLVDRTRWFHGLALVAAWGRRAPG